MSGSDLDQVNRPAFLSRIEEGAGPESRVFRDDASYAAKLKTLAPDEADRRLRLKLVKAVTRFELGDRLRDLKMGGLLSRGQGSGSELGEKQSAIHHGS